MTVKASSNLGFSLIELMIAMLLGLIISGGIIQLLVSTQATQELNRSLASLQEDGRFIIDRLRYDLVNAGFYDRLSPELNQGVDVIEESAFVVTHQVILPNDFASYPEVGSTQADAGGNDVLTIAYQGSRDCRGYTLGYTDEQQFFVVNQYFVDGNTLKCVGYDGRVLRGQRAAQGNNNNLAFSLLDNVQSFQVLYGVTYPAGFQSSGSITSYITAQNLVAAKVSGAEVVSIRLAILLFGDGELKQPSTKSYKLLNELPITPSSKQLFKQFDTTVLLRNPLYRVTRGM